MNNDTINITIIKCIIYLLIGIIALIYTAIKLIRGKNVKEHLQETKIPTKKIEEEKEEYSFVLKHERNSVETYIYISAIIMFSLIVFISGNLLFFFIVLYLVIRFFSEYNKSKIRIEFLGDKIVFKNNKEEKSINIGEIDKVIFKTPFTSGYYANKSLITLLFSLDKKRFPEITIIVKGNEVGRPILLSKENYLIARKYCDINNINVEDNFAKNRADF